MSWGAVIGAGGAILGGAMSSGGGGGATSSSSSEPWAGAGPLLAKQALMTNALQDKYSAMPFSQQQLSAINNIYGQSDYMRQLVPSLLGQLSAQPSGFDPNNPTAKPKNFDFGGLLGGINLNSQGLLAAQGRQDAIDAQDARDTADLVAGRRDTTRFFPLGLTYGDLKPKQ